MTTDIEIIRGGVVSVDSTELRAAADELTRTHHELIAEADDLLQVARELPGGIWAPGLPGFPPVSGEFTQLFPAAGDAAERAFSLAHRIEESAVTARGLAEELVTLAHVYENVELRAERAFAEAVGDLPGVARADDALRALAKEDVHAARKADELVGVVRDGSAFARLLAGFGPTWLTGAPDPSGGALPFLTDPGSTLLTAAAVVGTVTGLGARRSGSPPAGSPSGARARLVAHGPSAPPRALADLVGRVPTGDGPVRVRVDRFTMPDGEQRFAAYVTGTKTVIGADPWNMTSNLQLYGGARSSSLDVTLDALRAAGARRGDMVIPVGHSQGAMVAASIVRTGEYAIPAVTTAGSPTEVDPGPTTTSVVLRHTDDPVAALSGGGSPAPIGSRDSMVVQREADPARGWRDVSAPAHQIAAYVETAAAVDASDDPRASAIREFLAELGTATETESFEYAAEVSSGGEGGGRSQRSS